MIFTEKFKDTKKLREEAVRFERNGFYTKAPKGTIAYKEYWEEQRHRCLYGYEAAHTKITGRHYFYLNFSPIFMLKEGASKKEEGLPLFYDYDKYYFDMVDKALEENKGIVLLKGRRKGFSFKAASLLAYEYTFIKNSISFIGAYLEEYSKTTFGYAVNMLDFLLKHTAFGKKRIINKEDHKKAGYKLKNGAIGGTGNEIRYLTFKDNPSKSIGKSANLFIFEEVGKWHNIFESYMLTEPLLKEGNRFIGLPILQGTAGDLSEGITPFAEFFFNPEKYHFIAVDNIWDDSDKKIGLFFPASYGHTGIYGHQPYNQQEKYRGIAMMDEDGNSQVEVARQDILDRREMLGSSGNEKAKYIYITENPLKPSEAFMIAGLGLFNNERINAQITKVRSYREYEPQRGKLEWVIENGIINYDKVIWVPDREGKIKIWEHPVENITAHSPYISGIDPVDISILKRKAYHSDGAMLVFKGVHVPKDMETNVAQWHTEKEAGKKLYNALVCEYVDRPNDIEVFYENTLKINTYFKCFNRQCMVENNKKNIIDYYNRMRKTAIFLHGSPEIIEGKIEYNPSIKIGVTLTESVKTVAMQYLIQYLEKYTEHIFSEALLEELLTYNEIGNFDRVSALLMAILMFEEKSFIQNRAFIKKEWIHFPMYVWHNGKLVTI